MFVLFQSMHGEIGSDQKMKVLVFSDSHGNETNMITAIEQEAPDMVLHLGDCWEDAQELRWIYPELAIEQVPETVMTFRWRSWSVSSRWPDTVSPSAMGIVVA